MAEAFVLDVQERKKIGTNATRQLRKQGLVPAVIYGHKEATASLSVPNDALAKAIRQGVRIFDVTVNGAMQKALLRDIQWDSFGQGILHADFYRVSADETITLEVRVELRGTAPGIAGGGVLVLQLHNLSVECLVVAIPESIRVSVTELQLGQSIKVGELKLPEGVKVKNDPDAIVVQVSQKVEEEVTPTAPTAEQAEPEIIGKKAEDEAEEEKK